MDKRNNSNNVPSKPGWGRSMDLYESLDDLKRLRPLVQPNSNFLRQLTKWETDVSKNDVQDYNPYDFFSYQVARSILSIIILLAAGRYPIDIDTVTQSSREAG